jgi:hypothetical protein
MVMGFAQIPIKCKPADHAPRRHVDDMKAPFLAIGVFLYGGLLAGIVAGLFASGLLGTLAIVLIFRTARRGRPVRWSIGLTLLFLAGLIYLIGQFPFAPARPGNDYDLMMSNLFRAGFLSSAAPGVAAALASLVTWSAFLKVRNTTPATTVTSVPPFLRQP